MYKELRRVIFNGYGHLRLIIVIGIVTVLVSLLEGFNIGLLVPLLESLQSTDPNDGHWVTQRFAKAFNEIGIPFSLGGILIILGLLVIAQSTLKYIRMILVSKLTNGYIAWMRSRAMESMLKADVSYFHDERLGTLSSTLTTQSLQAGTTLFAMAEIFALIGVITSYLLAAFFVSPLLTMIALGIMFLITIMMQVFINRSKILGSMLVEKNNELHSSAVENLSGIRLIKSFLLESLRSEEFHQRTIEVSDTTYRIEKNRSQLTVIQEATLFGLVAALVFISVKVLSTELAVTVALLFILYRIAPRVSSLNNLRQTLAITLAALRAVDSTIEQTAVATTSKGQAFFSELSDSIRLEDVSFSYTNGTNVLNKANFSIIQGEITALVGSSGAGKSTLVDLILGFHDPQNGRILIDGVDLCELDVNLWRQAIGVVSQDVFLFNDTVANNITLGRADSSPQAVEHAAKQAYAHDFILGLPNGYDTEVGDRGWNLSGGQRQRLALARAILKAPQILILDEATSSLDSESEQLIQKYIKSIKGTCTIVVIAHRLATIQGADKIAVLQDGRIVEEGDWDSLIAKSGVFANYRRLQTGDSYEQESLLQTPVDTQ